MFLGEFPHSIDNQLLYPTTMASKLQMGYFASRPFRNSRQLWLLQWKVFSVARPGTIQARTNQAHFLLKGMPGPRVSQLTHAGPDRLEPYPGEMPASDPALTRHDVSSFSIYLRHRWRGWGVTGWQLGVDDGGGNATDGSGRLFNGIGVGGRNTTTANTELLGQSGPRCRRRGGG